MKKIFVDTNVLIHHIDWKIRLHEQIESIILNNYHIFVHQLVQNELIETLKKSKKLSNNAKIALKLIENYTMYHDPQSYPDTDTALLETTKREQGILLTFDKDLMSRCKKEAIPVLYSGKRKLSLIGYIEN